MVSDEPTPRSHEADDDAVIRLESTATAALAHTHRQTLRKLLQPAARALSVPATIAPVERVFTQGDMASS